MARPPTDEEFAEFVTASWPSLYRTAYLLLGDRGLAEDLVQTALAKTYGAWPGVRDVATAPAYARRTMVNTAASWFRRRSWRREHPTADVPDHAVETSAEDRPALLDALRQLSPRQRAVIVLRYYDDLSIADTAEALGCSAGTVKSQTSDALARLRLVLGADVVDLTSTGSHRD